MDSHNRSSRIDRVLGYIERLSDSDSLIVKALIICAFASFLWLIASLSLGWRTEVSVTGGVYREGIVGTPRFANPILAVTRADKDLAVLVFDGLMALGPDGTLVPNIAESVTASEDGLTYNVVLRKNVTFHDDMPLTALDVVFTVNQIKEPALTSPLRPNFDGVTVEQVGEYEVNFILPEPYAPFIENLTFGILPEHIWGDVTNEEFPFSQRNSEPIGSGPYAINKIVRNQSGIPEAYILKANEEYHRGEPKISTLSLFFFPNEDKLIQSFKDKAIDGMAGVDAARMTELQPQLEAHSHSLIEIPLPRTFAVFFNQSKSPALRDKGVREALDVAIDREGLTNSVLHGYGLPLYSPIPHGFGFSAASGPTTTGDKSEEARAILRAAGWKLNTERGTWEKQIDGALTPLELSLATVNNPIFEATAEFVRAAWERIGVIVTVKQFEQSDLTQGIIRPRDYEALLFGTHLGRPLDYYSFWHSSQRNDPGLNVALYTNITTDAMLTDARRTTDLAKRNEALTRFAEEITKETPALFLYQPELLYVFPADITGTSWNGIGEAHQRFASVHEWYANTESIWSFIAP